MKLVRIDENANNNDKVLVGKYELPEDLGNETKITYGATTDDPGDVMRIENIGQVYVETDKLNLYGEVTLNPEDYVDKYTLVFNKKYNDKLSEKLVEEAHDDFDDAVDTLKDIIEEGLSKFEDDTVERTFDRFDDIIEESVKEFFKEMKEFKKVSFK